MFKHLLVPLDGSSLAENVLPVAACLAETLRTEVTLLHVIEREAPAEVHGARHLRTPDEALAYLAAIRDRAFTTDRVVHTHVHTVEVKDVARSIVDHTGEFAADVIVMCAHGDSGMRRRLFGSNAQQVLALGRTPVLFVPTHASHFACRRILVPLDGEVDHEQGLQAAAALAAASRAAIHLLLVIPTRDKLKGEQAATGKLLPHTMTALLHMSEDSAEEYLRGHLQALRERGLSATAEIARGDEVAAILGAVQRTEINLIALGTHAKTGFDAFWSGSLTPQLLERSKVPVLLVRADAGPPL